MKKLISIQTELKVPKGNYNSFGKYKYRSCEDILESVKPLLTKNESQLILIDEVVNIGAKYFVKATASFNCDEGMVVSCGYAELSEHKGMSSEQCTGTASSYARKYALNGLFLIDETEQDADKVNEGKEQPKPEKWLNKDTKEFEEAIKYLIGGGKLSKIEEKYKISKEVRQMLMDNAI